jgi:hypothetical protein
VVESSILHSRLIFDFPEVISYHYQTSVMRSLGIEQEGVLDFYFEPLSRVTSCHTHDPCGSQPHEDSNISPMFIPERIGSEV